MNAREVTIESPVSLSARPATDARSRATKQPGAWRCLARYAWAMLPLLAFSACGKEEVEPEKVATTTQRERPSVDPNFFTSTSLGGAGSGSAAASATASAAGATTGSGSGTAASAEKSTTGAEASAAAPGSAPASAGSKPTATNAAAGPGNGATTAATVSSDPGSAAIAAAEASGGTQVPEYTGFEQKDVPPDFKLKVLANGSGTMSLRSLVGPENKKGLDGAIVAFTASWCGRCKASYPTLEALQAQYKGRMQIVLLTAEKDEEGKKKMVEVARQLKLSLPLLDAPPELVDQWLGEKQNIPRFYLLDYKGAVRVKDTGFGSKMEKLLPNQVAWLMERRNSDAQASATH